MTDVEELLREIKRIRELIEFSALNPLSWEVIVKHVDTPFVIGPGDRKTIFKESGVATVIFLLAEVNNPDAVVEFNYNGQKVRGSIRHLYERGMRSYNPGNWWIPVYDETNERYVAVYTPAYPYHFFGTLEITIYAPENEDVRVAYTCHYYRLKKRMLW